MSDRQYPHTVTVTTGRRTLRGCGGLPPVQRASVIEGDWQVRALNGKLLSGSIARIAFRGDRVTGTTGCNRFEGGFRFERGRLQAGPLATTRMACRGPLMAREAALLAVLGERLSVSSNAAGRLVLAARDGRSVVLARAPR